MDVSPALLLLDLQNDLVDPNGKLAGHGIAAMAQSRNVLANAVRALVLARAEGFPVVHVRLGFRADYTDALSRAPRIARLKAAGAAIAGTWGCEFHPAVQPLASERIFTKQCVNPFYNSGLLNWLLLGGVTEAVIAGVATNLAVESTARYADDAGLAVTVLEDCCAGANEELHRFCVEKMLPMFGRVIDVDSWRAEITDAS